MSAKRLATRLAALGGLAVLVAGSLGAEVRRVQETYTATTTGMTPAGVSLRFQVLEWSSDAARADVIASLEDKAALAKLPTVGYIWPSGSPVGYTVKYAHRSKTDDGRDRITFVTDKVMGSYDFKKWSVADGQPPPSTAAYSVVELYVDGDGSGEGNLSLATDVAVDTGSSTVTLASGDTRLLTDVKRQPST
jgi:hypothetical protein